MLVSCFGLLDVNPTENPEAPLEFVIAVEDELAAIQETKLNNEQGMLMDNIMIFYKIWQQ